MKEIYNAPALELLCLTPVEKLAETYQGSEIDYDALKGNSGIVPESFTSSSVEIDIPLKPK